ncbi:pheromone A receptor-domain-containing protein [Crassisporium funariophilum]|nr:pheromone A receptor-domain-containing protein [Crassisporium funariophilum]
MAVELPILSFLCAAILAVFIPVKRVRTRIPNLAIVLWLVGYNLVHGINALAWAGNNDWIAVTKLMLGANIALPGAFLCIARQLELVSSTRTFSFDPKVLRNRMFLEVLLCYILPVIYMSLHLITQDHRFDLVKDLGCSASIHPSTPAFMLTWIPLLLLCSVSFVLSVHNACRLNSTRFSIHLSTRSTMSSSLFVRRLITCMTMTGALSLIAIFSLFSVPIYKPWISWNSVHASMTIIDVISSMDEIKTVQLAWWGVFVVSILYILLVLGLGEESRDIYKSLGEQLVRQAQQQQPRFVLPIEAPGKRSPAPDMVSRTSLFSKPPSRPVTVELKSGWDDMLHSKAPKPKASRHKPKGLAPSSCSSPTASVQSATTDDEQFMASTMSYLGSPTAKTLGIAVKPLQYPSPALSPQSRTCTLEIPEKPTTPPPFPPQTNVVRNAPSKAVPVDVPSTMSSVFDASWPVPPVSPVPSLSYSRHGSHSRSHSPASSAGEETFGYPLYQTITPPHLRTRPFESCSISSLSEITSSVVPVSPLKALVKRPSLRGLRRSWSRDRMGHGNAPNEVIHMTVVKETV